MKKSHRTWLAVPPEEKDEASKAHPRLENGQNAIVWDIEHRLWYARPGVELNNFERWLPRPHDMSMNSDDPVTEFAQKLEDAGLVLKGLPVMDGTWQRVPTKNDKKGSKSGAYRGFLDGRPAGSYRDYRSADEKPIPWVYSGGIDMDPLARLHLRAHAQQTREDNARELEQQYSRQAGYATRYVSRLPQATTAPYLTRKGVDAAPGVRITPKGELVIPFSNAQGQIRSYQRIPETGGKDARILKDSEKTGNWFAMGTPVNGQPLLFAEGYATAASLHEASGLPVLMTIDAGNMIAVAQNARAVWPDSPFIFCADNDHQLKNPRTGEPENKGIISAMKAAELTNGEVIVPAFTLAELDQKLTDFNDLDVSRGRAVFHEEINIQLISAGVETPFSAEPHIREALARAGITSPSVQETIMENEENPGATPASGLERSTQPSPPEALPALATEQGQQAVQDYARLQNLELDAATLLQNAEADPAYKAGLTALFEQQGQELKANGRNIDTATFVETALRNLATEAQFDTRYAEQIADEAASAPSSPEITTQAAAVAAAGEAVTASPEPLTARQEPEQQAASDLARFIRSEIDAATLLQNADADPAYRAGLLAMFEQTGRDLQAQGHDIDIATYAEKTLRDLTGEIRMGEPVATSSPVTSEPVVPGQENSTEQAAVTGQEAGRSGEHPGDTPQASLQTPSVSEAVTSPQVDDTVPVIDLSALATNAGDDREPETPFIDMSAFAKEKPDPTRPAGKESQSQEQATTQSAEKKEATAEAGGPAEETDGIVWGPRRPEAPQKEDLEKIIKALTWEEQRDNTLLYRLDGEDAFRDLGNRLEMCNGASQDDRKVLAALAVAAKFYGGVIELTGSPEFKEKAMRLIIEHDLDIRMKIPAQRAQLEEMRKKMGASQDAVVPHQPTPDLNRHTQDAPPQAAADQTTKAAQEKSPDSPQQPQVPVPPKPTAPGNTPQQAEKPPAPIPPAPGEGPAPSAPVSPDANTIKVPEIPEEPAPSALSPGQSVTAVLKNYGEAMYENTEQRGKSFFIELENRGGSHTYWGQDLRRLVEHHKAGDVVTLTLNGRDSWTVPGEEKERVKNNWSLVATSTGIAVAHDRPEQGQRLQSFPIDTFGKLTQQIRQAWPDHMADLKLPPRFEDRLFWLGEDRHPVMAPQNTTGATAPEQAAPANITPIMASMDSQSKQMDLLLIQSAGEHLQGVVRLNGALYPALATPTADNTQLVINAVTDQGLRFAGYGQAVNFEPDGTTRAAPQLMTFHLKGREEDAPLPARLYTPEKQDDALFQRLGFEQTWKQWDDARKPEGRQEKTLHQEHSHSPGR